MKLYDPSGSIVAQKSIISNVDDMTGLISNDLIEKVETTLSKTYFNILCFSLLTRV